MAAFSWLVYFSLNPDRWTSADVMATLPEDFVADSDIGHHLFHIGGCANCHASSPDAPLGGGSDLVTFAGIFRSPNISPHPQAGIGSWSDADFVNAMKHGIDPDGRHYYPVFPYTSYAKSSVADLLHLKAFLDSLPAVDTVTAEHEINLVFRFRFLLAFWKLIFHDPMSIMHETSKDAAWNRGQSIVLGLGHCGECHTPRNILLARMASRELQGAPAAKAGEPPAPALAGLARQRIINGLDLWSGAVSEESAMHPVTRAFTEELPFSDTEAVADYLSSLPAD